MFVINNSYLFVSLKLLKGIIFSVDTVFVYKSADSPVKWIHKLFEVVSCKQSILNQQHFIHNDN